jgi:hypothetical protein
VNYHEREAAYRAAPGLNQSALKPLKLSPQHAKHAATAERKQSAAMSIGILTERLIACPDDLRMVVKPADGRTTVGQVAIARAKELGYSMLPAEDWAKCEAMANALRQDPQAVALLAGCEFGQPCYWTQDGQARKALFDGVDVSRNLVIDIKTTSESLTPKDIAGAVAKWGYDLQAAWYSQGYEATHDVKPDFWFVFVESSAPHAVVCVQLDDEWLAQAAEEAETLAQVWQACTDAGVWPGPGEMVVNGERRWPAKLTRPVWAPRYQLEV